ncbi:MAG: response regulator [Nannocystaceae bacterium]|nr:response regulator [Nannocystaceae bacterium]
MSNAMILVVDDSAMARHQVRVCLQSAGHSVIEAENGVTGLQKARDEPIDLAIIDVNMPIMDGLEMLAGLRSVPGKQSIPVFILTTDASKFLVARGNQHGTTVWIVKPFRPEVLARSVAHVLAMAV